MTYAAGGGASVATATQLSSSAQRRILTRHNWQTREQLWLSTALAPSSLLSSLFPCIFRILGPVREARSLLTAGSRASSGWSVLAAAAPRARSLASGAHPHAASHLS